MARKTQPILKIGQTGITLPILPVKVAYSPWFKAEEGSMPTRPGWYQCQGGDFAECLGLSYLPVWRYWDGSQWLWLNEHDQMASAAVRFEDYGDVWRGLECQSYESARTKAQKTL